MKRKIITSLIIFLSLTTTVKADFEFADGADFTGDSYFETSYGQTSFEGRNKHRSSEETVPLFKKLRLEVQNTLKENAAKRKELAPTNPVVQDNSEENVTSKYVSQEVTDNFEEMAPDGFEADEQSIEESGRKFLRNKKKNKSAVKNESTEDVILDCDNVDYDTQKYLIKANGNVSVYFVRQKTTVKSDILTFDRINNTIKAEGNVQIIKNERVITGDYIFVDMNEENALIENPVTTSNSIEIRSKKGYVYGDKITQEQGSFTITDSYPIDFRSGRRGPKIKNMLTPRKDTLTEDLENGVIRLRADSIKIKRKGDLEVLAIKKGKISKGKRTILYIPAIKLYTNRNHEYVETNFWEIGSYRGLGLYTGPGWVFELPKGSVLKAMPILNYNRGVGVGIMGRFSSGTNETTAAYGTAASKIFISGTQKLDDNLLINYSMNSYMDEWFLGRRRPKYGVALIYRKAYSSKGFLIPKQESSFMHRIEAGYFHDLDFDAHFERVKRGGTMGTTRFRYMAAYSQELFGYKNPEKMQAFSVSAISQISTALYGTGDTQVVAKFGPHVSMQYKRWMQDIGYSFNAFDDNTPMRRFDAFRYGTQYLYLREYFRLCKWLTLSWFTNINTTNDSLNGRKLQENAFYVSIGPDDFKLHLGYDFERQILRAAFEVMMDAKGASVEYNTFEITQDRKKPSKQPEKKVNQNLAPTQSKTLNRAVVENMKDTEDVL